VDGAAHERPALHRYSERGNSTAHGGQQGRLKPEASTRRRHSAFDAARRNGVAESCRCADDQPLQTSADAGIHTDERGEGRFANPLNGRAHEPSAQCGAADQDNGSARSRGRFSD
jgi:hypothetical protein